MCFVCDCEVKDHTANLANWLQVVSIDPQIVQAGVVYCNICKDTCAINTVNVEQLLNLIRGEDNVGIVVPAITQHVNVTDDWLDDEDFDEEDNPFNVEED
jgi:hypothetical protein